MKYFFVLVTLIIWSIAMPLWAKEYEKFAVYYADKAPQQSFAQYDLIILDSDTHPALEPLLARKKTLLGYLSLGEISSSRGYFNGATSQGFLLEENPNWPGSHAVDIRSPLWQSMVIEQLVPSILVQGFHGIFIDTLDTPIELERKFPTRYKGMQTAANNLIRMIRLHYPSIKIMLNRAYPLLPAVAGMIDMELGESIFASYDFNRKSYHKVENQLYTEQVKMLKIAQRLNPELAIYTLDYWNKDDTKVLSAIYKEQRKNGFIPYVATIGLDEIIAEPGE